MKWVKLTKGIQGHDAFSVRYVPFIWSDNTSVSWVVRICCSFYSECGSLRVGTIVSSRYNVISFRQSIHVSSTLGPNNGIELLGDTINNTGDDCISSRFNLLAHCLNIWWGYKTLWIATSVHAINNSNFEMKIWAPEAKLIFPNKNFWMLSTQSPFLVQSNCRKLVLNF